MINRRDFTRLAGIAATTTLLPSFSQAQETKPATLPPSIAQLKSRKAEARPITVEERQQRQERARQLMRDNNLDAILMIGGTSLGYFTNIRWWNSERLFAAVLPAKGEAFYVCPAFEEDRAREQIATGPGGSNADVRTWQEDEDPYRLVAAGLRDRGIASGHLGIDERTTFVFSDGVAKAAPQLNINSATPVTAGCRMIKMPHEIELMRLANQVTLQAYEAVYKALQPGMTQYDFANLIAAAYDKLGFRGEASVNVGEFSALPHGSVKPQVIREGTIVLIDDGCTVEGYQSDITRTFVLGKPTDKMRKVFEIVHRAQSAALKQARPGVEAQSVDAAARKIISDAGYGPDYKHFTHRLGHGIGMDGHEWPYLVRGNTIALRPGMAFSDEPGIYIRGEFGVRLEDDMHITEDGADLFTPQSPSLEDPFGKA
ncbi:MAG TPA: Xaa-Pro peptidase family protein [Terriglobales bacterium]|nr:Xaa-Pro peptidase family protein [Terriglobales bacterium]